MAWVGVVTATNGFFFSPSQERKVEADALVQEAEQIHRASYPEAEVFRALVNTFKTDLAERLSRAEQSQADLETTARLYRFCEQVSVKSHLCLRVKLAANLMIKPQT